MLCLNYQKLTPKERRDFIGEIVHCVQEDDELYELGKEIIRLGYKWGMFEGVTINPIFPEPENTDQIL